MHRILTVTTAAADTSLLTIEEQRQACGVDGSAQDAVLTALHAGVVADIMSECRVAVAGPAGVPTLRQETLLETVFDLNADLLMLSRRHNVVIAGVTLDGEALTASDYLVDSETGRLLRIVSDRACRWCADKLVVEYQAGFVTVPADLKSAAGDLLRLRYLDRDRNPAVRGEEIDVPGVLRERTEFWVGAVPGQSGDGPVPEVIAGQLARFRNAASR